MNELKKYTKINLACGSKIEPDFLNVDKYPLLDNIYYCDLLSFPWQLPPNHFFIIKISHFMEHIPLNTVSNQAFIQFMKEIFRISVNHALLVIISPYPSIKSLTLPNHTRVIDLETFNPFTKSKFSSCENVRSSINRLELISRKVYRKWFKPYEIVLSFRIHKKVI